MKSVVLDGFAVNPGDLSYDFLGKYGEYIVYPKTSNDDAIKACEGAEAVFTNRVLITEELLCAVPTIKYVSALGTGYDMIDVDACRRHGVEVCNIPDYSAASVAQLAITFIINLATDFNGLTDIVKQGKWTGLPGFKYQTVRNIELAGKTLGLIGCGSIGKKVGGIAAAFGMRVLAFTRSRQSGNEGCIEYMPLDRLLGESDFVSLHCPLTDVTRGMVNGRFISKMKKGACLINTARGAILDENAVADALNTGYLGGAGLDVLAIEPADKNNPLLTAKNCLITPHAAWTTIEARRRLLKILEDNFKSYIETGKGINRII